MNSSNNYRQGVFEYTNVKLKKISFTDQFRK